MGKSSARRAEHRHGRERVKGGKTGEKKERPLAPAPSALQHKEATFKADCLIVSRASICEFSCLLVDESVKFDLECNHTDYRLNRVLRTPNIMQFSAYKVHKPRFPRLQQSLYQGFESLPHRHLQLIANELLTHGAESGATRNVTNDLIFGTCSEGLFLLVRLQGIGERHA